MEIYEEMQQKINQLNVAIKELATTGSQYSKSYTQYRIALAQEIVRLKDEGMAITLCYDIARGKPDIARLKFAEIRDEALYKANQENINALKLQIRILESQLEREYNNKYSD